MKQMGLRACFAGLGILGFAGCGGGGGNPPAPTYTVSATISGLAGSGLILSNGADSVTVAGNGTTTFPTPLRSGSSYAVSIGTQPANPTQTCTVNNASGTVASTNITNITVACVTNTYAVGGTVSGLAGAGLMLLYNGRDELAIDSTGSVTFSTAVASGQTYDVRVLTQPAMPNQRCTVNGGRGTVTNAAITVAIDCVTQVPRVAYSVDFNDASVAIYAVDAATGQLRPRGHVRTGINPTLALSDPQQKFFFALSRGDATLSAFVRNDLTGALTEVAGSPYATGGTGGGEGIGPSSLAVHPTGQFIYVANPGAGNVAAFAIDPTEGTLNAVTGSPFATSAAPFWITLDASGSFAYVTVRGSNEIITFNVSATGVLSEVPSSRVATGATPGILLLHPNGRFGYVPNLDDGTISAFTVDPASGALTAISGSPFTTGSHPAVSVFLHPKGQTLYLRDTGAPDAPGSMAAYAIDQSSGALTPLGAALPIDANSTRATIDPAGRFIFVANRGTVSGSLSAFSIDATGALTSLPGVSSLQPGPYSVAVDPSSRYVYASSAAGNAHYAYALDAASGALTALSRAPIVIGRSQPISLTVYSSQSAATAAIFRSKLAYVANGADNSVSGYAINPVSGTLTAVNTIASAGTGPRSAAVHPNSGYLFVSNETSGATGVASHTIDAASGALSPAGSSIPTGTGVTSLIASPHGKNVYVINPVENLVQGYGVEPASGALAPLTGFNAINTFSTPATAIAIAPNGRYLHFITDSAWGRDQFDSQGGFTGTGGSSGLTPGKTALAIEPNGRFAYVALAGSPSGSIEQWAINPVNGGFIAAGTAVPTGAAPKAIAVEPTGRFLYTANSGSNDVAAFAIDPVTGALSEILPRVAAGSNPVAIAADYSGAFVYVLSRDTNTVLSFAVDANSGALTPVGIPVATGSGANQVALSAEME